MFFERFRTELQRYADGVHEAGEPARDWSQLPPGLRDLYRSWNGLKLFTDSIVLEPISRITREGELWRVGEALGAPLVMDAAGHIFELDPAGERVLAGSSVEKWLDAMMAREKLVVDREGEFKDVFDPGGELSATVREKRARAAHKIDPGAAVWNIELADLAFEAGDVDLAAAALERAVASDPQAASAWAMLGGVHHRAARLDEAERAFAQAAGSTREASRRAERWAEAARAAGERGDESGRAEHAERARAADPQAAKKWADDARRLLDEGDPDGAHQRAALAAAIDPAGEGAMILKQARLKRALKTF